MRGSTAILIRKAASAEDWLGIRELCCRTGDNGAPVARERWPFFGEQWIGPYQKLLPGWTWVADAEGVVIGYLTGCPETGAFARRRFFRWTPRLLFAALSGRPGRSVDTRRFARRALGLERAPADCFSREVRRRLRREFPAHLHMNVDAACRGLGLGKRLALEFFAALSRAGKPGGVHVFCGPDPVRFYESVGFRVLGTIELKGAVVHAMGRAGEVS